MIGIFSFSVSFVFYQLLTVFGKYQQESKDLFQLFLEIISHKFGNFLAGQKVNLALAKKSNTQPEISKVLSRLERSVNFMQEELITLLKRIENVKSDKYYNFERQLSLDKLVQRQISVFHLRYPNKKLPSLKLVTGINELGNSQYEIIVELLIENCLKYSKDKVYIRSGLFKGSKYLFLCNDITKNKDRYKGLNIGLSIVHFLVEKQNLKIKIKEEKGFFKVFLLQRKRSRYLFRNNPLHPISK